MGGSYLYIDPLSLSISFTEIHGKYILPLQAIAILIEEFVHIKTKKVSSSESLKDILLHIAIRYINIILYYLAFVIALNPIANYISQYQFVQFYSSHIAYWLGIYLLVDFTNYWIHRWQHTYGFMWAFHEPHHSSQRFHMLLHFRGIRLKMIFNMPIMLLYSMVGLNPIVLVVCQNINKLFQFYSHLSFLGSWGIFEKLLATPRNHFVHHCYNGKYKYRNYAATLLVWDKLFGTYQPYDPGYPAKLGLATGHVGHNPFYVVFRGLLQFFGLDKEKSSTYRSS